MYTFIREDGTLENVTIDKNKGILTYAAGAVLSKVLDGTSGASKSIERVRLIQQMKNKYESLKNSGTPDEEFNYRHHKGWWYSRSNRYKNRLSDYDINRVLRELGLS